MNTIRDLNDGFRTTLIGGTVVLTHGVATLPEETRKAIIEAIKIFGDFPEGDDPHQEHDFGAFELASHKFFWKIDYFDKTLMNGSEDPANIVITTRVLTIMLADEY